MKKLVLFTAATLTCLGSFAQNLVKSAQVLPNTDLSIQQSHNAHAKGAANGDTFLVRNYATADTLTYYSLDFVSPSDSGYLSGNNVYGYKGFAERFDFKGSDSSVSVLGAAIYLIGTATANSTKSINVKAWSQGAVASAGLAGRTHLFYNGKPNTVLATLNVPLTTLRKSTGRIDSFRVFRFATPTTYITDSFFVGYDMSYTFGALAGDTVITVVTKNGNRHTPSYFTNGLDTVLNVQNATQTLTGNWVDNYFEGTYSQLNHYAMYALFKVKYPTDVHGITKNSLTVFGNFPNPASNNTNLKFALKDAADITVRVMDASGRTVKTIELTNQSAGNHLVNISTSDLANGDYYSIIQTSTGDGMGIQMTVAH